MVEVVITGYGLLSSLGEGDAAYAGFKACVTNLDSETFAPYPVHALKPVEFEKQIPKKDARQMEQWQRIGVYAAGLALDMAGVKGNSELLSTMHMIVAAGGGERDYATDSAIMTGLAKSDNQGAYLNERLNTDIRPTLFLAQLSNLLAGNISIVHGVVGSSRTFMGEEMAGVDAVMVAFERIKAKQGELFLVGGAYNAEREDILLHYICNQQLHKGAITKEQHGMILGSASAFLVVESAEHAKARGAKALAKITHIDSTRVNRDRVSLTSSLEKLWHGKKHSGKVFSNASFAPETFVEMDFNQTLKPVYLGKSFGHAMEAAFPLSVIVATQSILDDGEAVTIQTVGHWRGEALARVEAV
jgi:3-oxoacyl-[acyl-carrier-protein] synthase II